MRKSLSEMKPEELRADISKHLKKKKDFEEAVKNDPLGEITKEVQKHISGQDLTIKFVTILKAMAQLDNCKGTSTNVLFRSESGAGKDSTIHEIIKPWSFENHERIQKLTKDAIS